MKAYYPMLKYIDPHPTTFILEPVPYYVTVQTELVSLDSKSAAICNHVYDGNDNKVHDELIVLEYNALLGKVPVYGTKNDCDSACKILNHDNKEKASLTIQRLSII